VKLGKHIPVFWEARQRKNNNLWSFVFKHQGLLKLNTEISTMCEATYTNIYIFQIDGYTRTICEITYGNDYTLWSWAHIILKFLILVTQAQNFCRHLLKILHFLMLGTQNPTNYEARNPMSYNFVTRYPSSYNLRR
jgi:hypothetical protein